MDVSVPVDSRVFIQKRALWKYLADSALTEVVGPDGRQNTLNHGKVLIEATTAGIERLEFTARGKGRCYSISQCMVLTHCSIQLPSVNGTKLQLRPTMLHADKQQSGVAIGRWLLREQSRRGVLLTSMTHAKVPRPPV